MAETALHHPGIGDDADDGAEQDGDQDVARAVMGFMHGADYAGRETGVQIAVD